MFYAPFEWVLTCILLYHLHSRAFLPIIYSMATRDSNRYGKIVITNKAIRSVANFTLTESYGVSRGFVTSVIIENNRIKISLSLKLKYGVTLTAMTESIRQSVKFNVENFTGMPVEEINIRVMGIE